MNAGRKSYRRRGARARDLLNVLRSNGTVFSIDFRSHRRLLARFPLQHVIFEMRVDKETTRYS